MSATSPIQSQIRRSLVGRLLEVRAGPAPEVLRLADVDRPAPGRPSSGRRRAWWGTGGPSRRVRWWLDRWGRTWKPRVSFRIVNRRFLWAMSVVELDPRPFGDVPPGKAPEEEADGRAVVSHGVDTRGVEPPAGVMSRTARPTNVSGSVAAKESRTVRTPGAWGIRSDSFISMVSMIPTRPGASIRRGIGL